MPDFACRVLLALWITALIVWPREGPTHALRERALRPLLCRITPRRLEEAMGCCLGRMLDCYACASVPIGAAVCVATLSAPGLWLARTLAPAAAATLVFWTAWGLGFRAPAAKSGTTNGLPPTAGNAAALINAPGPGNNPR